jgi:beta-galactosidase beta subunit
MLMMIELMDLNEGKRMIDVDKLLYEIEDQSNEEENKLDEVRRYYFDRWIFEH